MKTSLLPCLLLAALACPASLLQAQAPMPDKDTPKPAKGAEASPTQEVGKLTPQDDQPKDKDTGAGKSTGAGKLDSQQLKDLIRAYGGDENSGSSVVGKFKEMTPEGKLRVTTQAGEVLDLYLSGIDSKGENRQMTLQEKKDLFQDWQSLTDKTDMEIRWYKKGGRPFVLGPDCDVRPPPLGDLPIVKDPKTPTPATTTGGSPALTPTPSPKPLPKGHTPEGGPR